MINDSLKPKYPGWCHSKIINHQRKIIRDMIRGSSGSVEFDFNRPIDPDTAKKIRAYVDGWDKEERDNDYLNPFPLSLAFLDSDYPGGLARSDSRSKRFAGGGSSVKLELTANQMAQETLRSVSQPRLRYDPAGEHIVEWDITDFVWWSEFLGELSPAYRTLLRHFDFEKEDYYADCNGFYCYHHSVKNPNCSVNSIYVPVIDCGKYHPYTSVKHRRRASVRALDRLEFLQEECRKRRVKFDYLVCIDLTLPKAVSEKWYDDKIQKRIRRAVIDFLGGLHKELFPKKSSRFGVIKNPHYWATKSPLDPHRHIHLTMPNVTYNKNTDMFHRFKPYIDKDLIKQVWKKCLIKNNLWFGVSPDRYPVIWTEYIRFDNRGKVLHRLGYCARKPIEDLEKFLELADVTGDFDEDFAEFLLEYTPRRINLGFLTNLKRFGYRNKSTPFRCPLCGCEMEPERNDRGRKRLRSRPPPETLHLFRDRTGKWRETINLARG